MKLRVVVGVVLASVACLSLLPRPLSSSIVPETALFAPEQRFVTRRSVTPSLLSVLSSLGDNNNNNNNAQAPSTPDQLLLGALRIINQNPQQIALPDAVQNAMAQNPQQFAASIQRVLGLMQANSNPAQAGQDASSSLKDLIGLSGSNPLPALSALSPGAPGAPSNPTKPFIETMSAGFDAIATLFVLKVLLPMLMNPALVMQFQSPKLMTQNPPALPAPYREANPDVAEYYHPYGNWGDYGYEAMGYQGYGCAKGNCAPWWWSWTRKNKQFAPFSKTAPAMD